MSTLHGQLRFVDRDRQPERRLLAQAVKAMELLGLQFRVLQQRGGDPGPDATLGLRFGGRELRYLAEVKRGLRPATLGAVIHQLRTHGDNTLLVADHVTPPLADALRAQGIEFIDAAGNAFLNHAPLLVFVKGQRPIEEAPAIERGRAFQATGLQVLFVLLARPELVTRPYRRSPWPSEWRTEPSVGYGGASRPRLRRQDRRRPPPHQRRALARPMDRSVCADPPAQAAPGPIRW